jgi:hypothetical protein
MKTSEINPGHYLEIMDRLHIIICTLNDHCVEHPITKSDCRIESLLIKATEELLDAYQIAGEIFSEENDK